MKAFARSLSTAAICSLAIFAVAQAPIVRQPPPSPDEQQPAYSAPPADQPQGQPEDQMPAPPNYDQMAQTGQPSPALLPPQQLDQLVSRIALYPDPLLAQTLTASTYWDEVPTAAAWANRHSYIKGDALNAAIQEDNLPWDPSVLALLPFPSVLDGMASDPDWTAQLGSAVLSQPNDVMDAVQRLRRQAYGYGYLASNAYLDVIDDGGYIQIQPFNPDLYYVPVYKPLIVFARPRPGFFVGDAIRFGPAVPLGVSFGRFGWFGAGFTWGSHALLIGHRPWTRTYANRSAYVAPYAHPYVRPTAPMVERHQTQGSRTGQKSRPSQTKSR